MRGFTSFGSHVFDNDTYTKLIRNQKPGRVSHARPAGRMKEMDKTTEALERVVRQKEVLAARAIAEVDEAKKELSEWEKVCKNIMKVNRKNQIPVKKF